MGFFKKRIKKTKDNVVDAMELGIFVSVFGMVKDVFITLFMPWKKGEIGVKETYEEAIKRLNLSEADIKDRKKMFAQQTIMYLVSSLLLMAYGVYLAFQLSLTGVVLAFMVAGLCLSYAFRSHFWLFQLKQKKLGCTFKEYWDSSLKG